MNSRGDYFYPAQTLPAGWKLKSEKKFSTVRDEEEMRWKFGEPAEILRDVWES